MSSDQVATDAVAPPKKQSSRNRWLLLIVGVVVLDIAALIAFPPSPKGDPGAACPFPACFIESTLEFPAPHTVIDLAPGAEGAGGLVTFHPAISNTHFHGAFQAKGHDCVSWHFHRAAANFTAADGADNCADNTAVGL